MIKGDKPMNRKWTMILAAMFLGLAALPGAHAAEMSEKEKALASPYPNDLATDAEMKEIDAMVKTYPANIQKGYDLLVKRCAQCHEAKRPLNSRFVEPEGGMDDAKQQASLDALKKANPEMFKDLSIWQPEVKVWNRYVKRMMNKPGCNIEKAEGKQIWEFLEYDGVKRKTGANAAKWAAHRKELLERFKAKNPKRYEELKAANDL